FAAFPAEDDLVGKSRQIRHHESVFLRVRFGVENVGLFGITILDCGHEINLRMEDDGSREKGVFESAGWSGQVARLKYRDAEVEPLHVGAAVGTRHGNPFAIAAYRKPGTA